jgi:aminopeptidase-like protein
MANDNLSGLIVQALLASKLANNIPYHSYRFIFVPETIGAIAYCHKNQKLIQNLEGGFILSNVGGPGGFSYKRSFDANHYLNDVVEQAFRCLGIHYEIYPFDIHGSDERQYSSIGFRINMPSVHKDKYYEFDQYHTSLDNLQFVKAENLIKTLFVYEKIIEIIESNRTYLTVKPECEVYLNEHGLYPNTSGYINQSVAADQNLTELDQILWLLFLSDGKNNLLEISQQTNFDIVELQKVAEKLKDHGIMVMKNE